MKPGLHATLAVADEGEVLASTRRVCAVINHIPVLLSSDLQVPHLSVIGDLVRHQAPHGGHEFLIAAHKSSDEGQIATVRGGDGSQDPIHLVVEVLAKDQ